MQPPQAGQRSELQPLRDYKKPFKFKMPNSETTRTLHLELPTPFKKDNGLADSGLVHNGPTSSKYGGSQSFLRPRDEIGLSESPLVYVPQIKDLAPRRRKVVWVWVCCVCQRPLQAGSCPPCLECPICKKRRRFSTETTHVSDKVEEPTKHPPAFVASNERPRATSITWPSGDIKTGGTPCYEVPGFINGIAINGLPDSGSSVDCVSEMFIQRHSMKLEITRSQMIRLPGGSNAESVGKFMGYFKFQNEERVYRREFHVLRNCVYDLVLGREFLDMTKVFTEFRDRIIKRIRPCVRRGNHLFLLDEGPKNLIRCAINGAEASAFPDTGSDLMIASGGFARRHNLKVHRGEKYRRPVELIDGTVIRTDGMVLGAELQFDVSTSASQVLDYDAFCTILFEFNSTIEKATSGKNELISEFVLKNVPDSASDVHGLGFSVIVGNTSQAFSGKIDVDKRTVYILAGASNTIVEAIVSGAKITIDDRWCLAMHTFHRHQLPLRHSGVYGKDYLRNDESKP
ncbi:hypothetical protein FPSE5266_03714 [Fusarium pseudograminearum]|nr:hypothetical protein FPSE5266_03714 [Fusarium pseudograminearum]